MPRDLNLSQRLEELRQLVQARLQSDTQLPAECPARLSESVRYSLLAPGKRVRPCLTLLACETCGGDLHDALPAASAIEMVHCYSLIHDDLPAMDDDDLRRGVPTNHVQFGEATAILAGDGLLTLAFEVMARDIASPQLAVSCILDLANAAGVVGMVGGQQADLEAETTPAASVEELEAIHRRKTGRLLCSALTMGGRLGGADDNALALLRTYGESVGLAFQIADDLLDVIGDPAALGKGTQKDASLGKSTYPGFLGVDESKRRAQALADRACDAVAPWGEQGRWLQALAQYIVQRDR